MPIPEHRISPFELTMNSQTILQTWIDGVNSCNLEAILALYATDAVILPTFSARTLHTGEARRQYFEQLAARESLSVTLRERTVRVQSLGSGPETISGIYCFRFSVDDELLSFEARFTYVVNPELDRPILHHHSSQIPRQLS